MSTIAHYRQLAAHDAWANQEFAAALEKTPGLPPRAQELLAHIIAAQWVWLTRMNREPQKMEVWPELSVQECRAEFAKLKVAWEEFFKATDLNATFAYTNTKGESFESRVGDTLTHVFLHGHYHRGQIALLMRQAGVTPPYTDFIEAVRKGYI